ncbi:MAG: TM2 domain-containing protein [Desulfurivibrionaceae bacterium]
MHEQAVMCVSCGVPPKNGSKYCQVCAAETNYSAEICIKCGVRLSTSAPTGGFPLGMQVSQKSKPTATLLGIFLGPLGALKFYMGSWGWGIVYLVLCLTFFLAFIPIIASIVEYIRIILMSDDEFAIKAEAFKNKGPFGFFW